MYPLHAACSKGDVRLACELVSQGHFVNETNFDLVQPLHEASFYGSEECIQFLLDSGAQVNMLGVTMETIITDQRSR